APHFALAGADGEFLHQGAFGTEHLAEEIAGLQDGEHRAALALPLAEQPDAPRTEEEHLVRRHARPVDDRAMSEGLDLEVAAKVDDVGCGKARGGERGLELVPRIYVLLTRDHGSCSGYRRRGCLAARAPGMPKTEREKLPDNQAVDWIPSNPECAAL